VPSAGQSVVTFHTTAFNMTERKPYFINDCCYGDDLARWMIAELKNRGIHADAEPGQEDFGWYLTFELANTKYFFLISYRPDDITKGATWIGFIERKLPPLKTLLRASNKTIPLEAPQAIDQVLSNSTQIRDIRWHAPRRAPYE
jgi:hypothetical protein